MFTIKHSPEDSQTHLEVGTTFNSWKISKATFISGIKSSRRVQCRCICGVERAVPIHKLYSGRSKSCGCGRKKTTVLPSGKVFGFWTTQEEIQYRGRHGGNDRVKVRCVCGVEKSLRIYTLLNQESTSCGCRGLCERIKIGTQFTRWKVVEAVREEDKKVKCACICGNIRFVSLEKLLNGRSKGCGCLQFAKIEKNKQEALSLLETTVSTYRVLSISTRRAKGVRLVCKCIVCGKDLEISLKKLRKLDKTFHKSDSHCSCHRKPKQRVYINLLYRRSKGGSKKRLLEFLLTREEFEILIDQPCYYCGVPPSEPSDPAIVLFEKRAHNGVDRKDSSKGYISNNCVPCCKDCNYAKHSKTEREFGSYIERVYLAMKAKGKINV